MLYVAIAVAVLACILGLAGLLNLTAALTLALLTTLLSLYFAWSNGQAQTEEKRLHSRTQKRAEMYERELRRQRDVVDSLADGLDVSILVCDPKGIVEYANRAAIQFFNINKPEGRSITALSISGELSKLIDESVRKATKMEAELSLRIPDERSVLAQVWADTRNEDRVFVTLYDVSRLKRLERTRQDFVANVSHELRTPLTTIRAMSETLLDSPPVEQAELGERYLPKIIAEVDRLTLIATDLLTLTISETTDAIKSPTDMTDLVERVVTQLQPVAKEKGLTLTCKTTPEIQVNANANQLTQIVINIIENSIKYSQSGSIHVSLSAQESEVIFKVADQGLGIPMDDQERIFERFYRVEKGRSRESGGTGLGLAIVKHMVEQHAGRIKLESTLGIGSTFTVFLPRLASPTPHQS